MSSLIVERDERGVVSAVLNRPEKKNAIDFELFRALRDLFEEVTSRDEDRVLVLTGADGNFSTGADLAGGGTPDRHQLDLMQFYGSVGLALHQVSKPTIAKINGVAVGAGLNLALGCDLIVAGESARFSEIFVKRGLAIDLGGSWLLPRLVGLHQANELALLGDILHANEAERNGIGHRLVREGEPPRAVAARKLARVHGIVCEVGDVQDQ